MILAQLTDLHVGASGDADPLADARRAVDWVAAMDPRPDAVLVSGDLTEHGTPEEYAAVRELVAGLGVPVHVLAGNHDDPVALGAAFPADGAAPDRRRWAADCGALRVVGCHTPRPGRPEGGLDADELAWLRDRLAEAPETPTIVAMHHPPIPIGVPAFDRIGLPDADRRALAAVLRDAPQVQRVVAGHVHLPAFGRVGATPAMTCPSTWRDRARLQLGAETWQVATEPAGLAIHALVDGELVSHVQPLPG